MSALAGLGGSGQVHLFFMVDAGEGHPLWYVHGNYDGDLLDLHWDRDVLARAGRTGPAEVHDLTVDVARSGGSVAGRQLLTEALAVELGAAGSGRAEANARRAAS